MSDYDNTNRGCIWKNNRKSTDKHPDFTGTLNVEGREYFFDAWRRREGASANSPALSFRIKPRDGSANDRPGGSENGRRGEEPNDDIPF